MKKLLSIIALLAFASHGLAQSYNSLAATAAGHWPLQDNAASTVIVGTAGGNGTLNGGDNTADIDTTGPGAWLPSALQFDGTADYITTTFVPTGTAGTLLGWSKKDDVSGIERVASSRDFANNDGVILSFTDATVRGGVGSGSGFYFSGSSTVSVSAWNHTAVRFDGTDVEAFLNGVSAGTATSTGTLDLGDYLAIARDPNSVGYMDGAIAEVMYFTSKLTTAEIAQIYNGPEPTYTSGASIADNGAYNVGTWDSQSNGTATYEIVAAEADGTPVDTATAATGTLNLSSAAGQLVYLYVRTSNDGGYDIGDHSTRTGAYGSSGDGYYELDSVTAASSSSIPVIHHYRLQMSR